MNTISKQQQKYIQSLHNKKYRKQFGEFMVEGKKSMKELAASDYVISKLYLSKEGDSYLYPSSQTEIVDEQSIQKSSFMQNNSYGLAIVKSKELKMPQSLIGWHILADDVKDPGNLGTIIRLADWYGIENIFCSSDTVDFQNPKVVASTMGSFARVNIWYCDLINVISQYRLPIYGASMEGTNVHKINFPENGFLLMGSESHGITVDLRTKLEEIIAIPAYGNAESLNVAVATGILLDNIRRSTDHQTIV